MLYKTTEVSQVPILVGKNTIKRDGTIGSEDGHHQRATASSNERIHEEGHEGLIA
jgi:hypothetical protein